jgi:hypothetical protein
MYIPKSISQARITAFQLKYSLLSSLIGKLENRYLFYTATDFIAMMRYLFTDPNVNGLRIYIASYSQEGDSRVPANCGELLTVIYASTKKIKGIHKDTGNYFTLAPGGSFDPNQSKLDNIISSEWVSNYQNSKLPILNATVTKSEGDTKSIHYTKEKIVDLIEEMLCQQATGIRAYFCTIADASVYQQKLMLEFMLTTKIDDVETEFFIDDREGFSDRPDLGNLDTGNPCPPATCGGAYLPLP